MNEEKIVKVNGYFNGNLGDDLFYKILFERYSDINFYIDIMPGFYNRTLMHSNVITNRYVKKYNAFYERLLKSTGNRLVYKILFKLDDIFSRRISKNNVDACAEVMLIGSLFCQHNGKGKPLELDKIVIEDKSYQLKKRTPPFYLLGVNIGPVFDMDYVNGIKGRLDCAKDVCMRDKASYQLFSFMENVRYAPDIVFNLNVDKYKNVTEEKSISVNFIDLAPRLKDNQISVRFSDKEYKNQIIRLLYFYLEKGYKINLVSFCKKEGDEYLANQVFSSIKKKYRAQVKKVYYDGDYEKILNAYAQSRYIIAGRFHAMILAMLLNKPFFPVCYNDKMEHYLQDVSFCGKYCSIGNFCSLTETDVNANFNNYCLAKAALHIAKAKEQFQCFDYLAEKIRMEAKQ